MIRLEKKASDAFRRAVTTNLTFFLLFEVKPVKGATFIEQGERIGYGVNL